MYAFAGPVIDPTRGGRGRPCTARRWWRRVAVLLVLFTAAGAAAAQVDAPDLLVKEYLQRRTRAIAEQHLQKSGMQVRPQPPVLVPTRSDSIRQRILAMHPEARQGQATPTEPTFDVHVWHLAGKYEREWYRRRFEDVHWAYLGANTTSPLDTLPTRELRARLEARFGAPTQRLTDLSDDELRARDDFPQFEYWFVLNGEVPFVVMDTNGPFERGLVVGTDHRYRDRIAAMRRTFLGALAEEEEAPYFDYYFDKEDAAWYRTHFDGNDYVVEPGRPPNLQARPLRERIRLRADEARQ